MSVFGWIATGLLVLAMGGIGAMKLVGNEEGIEQAIRLGYNSIRIPIGIAEVLSAVAVIIGAVVDDLSWLGTLAGFVIIAMMIGAMGFHIRARDTFELLPSVIVAGAAVIYIVALSNS